MPDPATVVIELVGTSDHGYEAAINSALARADQTLVALEWFEVKRVRGPIANGRADAFEVTLDVGFRLLEGEELTTEMLSQLEVELP